MLWRRKDELANDMFSFGAVGLEHDYYMEGDKMSGYQCRDCGKMVHSSETHCCKPLGVAKAMRDVGLVCSRCPELEKENAALKEQVSGKEHLYGCEITRLNALANDLRRQLTEKAQGYHDTVIMLRDAQNNITTLRRQLAEKDKELTELRGCDAELRSAMQILEGLKDFATQSDMNWIQKCLLAVANMREQLAEAQKELDTVGVMTRDMAKSPEEWMAFKTESAKLLVSEQRLEIKNLKAQLEKAREALTWLENWFRLNNDAGGKHACPWCYKTKDESAAWSEIEHDADCAIGAALSEQPEAPKLPCKHDRLDEEGICRNCGGDCRSGHPLPAAKPEAKEDAK